MGMHAATQGACKEPASNSDAAKLTSQTVIQLSSVRDQCKS